MVRVKVVDIEKCIGCELCEKVCEFINSRPRAKIVQTGDGVLVPITCLHCTTPICVDVCPTGALHKDADGPIHLSRNRCIGCKLCSAACPFGVPDVDSSKGLASKCDLCSDRERQGLEPACAEVCPAGAILCGEYSEVVEASESKAVALLTGKKVLQRVKH